MIGLSDYIPCIINLGVLLTNKILNRSLKRKNILKQDIAINGHNIFGISQLSMTKKTTDNKLKIY